MTDDIEFHGRRCAWLCALLCTELGMPTHQVFDIASAALTHDVGKHALPASLLNKPTELTPHESELLRQHCVLGAWRLMSEAPADRRRSSTAAVAVALSHHEWWNGQGYPFGLSGEAIPLCARVVAVVDVFDALMTRRSYKHAWSFQAALDYIAQRRGTQFDPACVDALLAIAPDLPSTWQADAEERVQSLLADLQQLDRQGAAMLAAPNEWCGFEASKFSA